MTSLLILGSLFAAVLITGLRIYIAYRKFEERE